MKQTYKEKYGCWERKTMRPVPRGNIKMIYTEICSALFELSVSTNVVSVVKILDSQGTKAL